MPDELVRILENRGVNEKYYKLVFRSQGLSRRVAPGQFMQIQLDSLSSLLWRRPFSYYRVRGKSVEVLYEILGRGTAFLARKRAGEPLKALGPLGRGFRSELRKKKRVLIAGGVGVPPLVFIAETYPTDYLLIGTKSKKEVLPKAELARVRAKILYSTNDGSYGAKGLVTHLLEKLIEENPSQDFFIQTCGPNAMMKAVVEMARRRGIEGEASWDKPMACGVGVCLGCMVKTKEGWTASCTHGPVFGFEELVNS